MTFDRRAGWDLRRVVDATRLAAAQLRHRPGPAFQIPRLFHRFWVGGPMPPEFQAYGETWSRHHPGWRMLTWDETNLPRLQNRDLFVTTRPPSVKSDIGRYEILHLYGGIYLDTDFECLRNLEDLLPGIDAFAATEDGQWVSGAIMGAVPGHPFMSAMIRAVRESFASQPDAPPNELSGPKLLTRIVEQFALNGNPITVFPSKWFYPYHFSQPERGEQAFPSAYAVHHWASSWSPSARPSPPLP